MIETVRNPSTDTDLTKNSVQYNVLVVENHPDTGNMITTALIAAGYGVRLAATRDIAAAALNRYIYQYTILDYAMPGMSMETFLVEYQSRAGNIILISAIIDPEMMSAHLKIGAWLRKPFSPDELIATLRGFSSGSAPAVGAAV